MLLAHRGLAQTFPISGLGASQDTSKLIYPPEHPFIENTIPSMEAAFQDGADIVEFYVQLTADDRMAVFQTRCSIFAPKGTARCARRRS
ncbi:MAG TPA: glycerophosphodiester phosphodiesterase family protein, partial [Polyangiaceae bacterium]|nr:glycerophosphodiester phosphodiesterase family protein [Polyangiaceae bacterium]